MSCKQTIMIALEKAITAAVDRTTHISICIAAFSDCLHCDKDNYDAEAAPARTGKVPRQ
jgi:hypothetical protein